MFAVGNRTVYPDFPGGLCTACSTSYAHKRVLGAALGETTGGDVFCFVITIIITHTGPVPHVRTYTTVYSLHLLHANVCSSKRETFRLQRNERCTRDCFANSTSRPRYLNPCVSKPCTRYCGTGTARGNGTFDPCSKKHHAVTRA